MMEQPYLFTTTLQTSVNIVFRAALASRNSLHGLPRFAWILLPLEQDERCIRKASRRNIVERCKRSGIALLCLDLYALVDEHA